jgi:KUP system potassium uptake protein
VGDFAALQQARRRFDMRGTDKPQEASDDPGLEGQGHRSPRFWVLTLGSIGVVYGDIGTSPLYALREAVLAAMRKDGAINEAMIYGVVSLILWALILVVTVKYVLILLNADNKGEGGTLSLMALAQRAMGNNLVLIPILGMIGAALFYGDAIITPAISVLSAVEGLKIVTPAFDPYVLWITIAILIALLRCRPWARRASRNSLAPSRSCGSWSWPGRGSSTSWAIQAFFGPSIPPMQ